MTSQQQRLEELKQRAKELAERIDQLEEQINNTQPTTGLLGRWAKHPKYGDVMVVSQHADSEDGNVCVVFPSEVHPDGTDGVYLKPRDLTLPEQTTRPEDVPVGEAWLVNTCDATYQERNVAALKCDEDIWTTASRDGHSVTEWLCKEVELITPLIPARPHDTPETVTTEEEYEALPQGSVVAESGRMPWVYLPNVWVCRDNPATPAEMAGTTRHVLRWGR